MVTAVSRNGIYAFTKPVRDEITLIAGFGVEGDAHAGVTVKHRGRVKADPTQPNLRQVHLIQGELFDEVRGQGYEVAAGQLGENVTTSGIDLLGLPCGTILRFGPPADAATERATQDQTRVVSGMGAEALPGPGAAGAAGAAVAGVVAAARNATLDGPTAAAVEALVAAAERDDSAGPSAASGDPRVAVVITGLRNPCAQINGFRPGLLKEVLGRDEAGNLIRKAGVMGVVLRGGRIRPGDQVTVELPPRPHFALDRV
jgi:MOSC domain-containing protein YiiM